MKRSLNLFGQTSSIMKKLYGFGHIIFAIYPNKMIEIVLHQTLNQLNAGIHSSKKYRFSFQKL